MRSLSLSTRAPYSCSIWSSRIVTCVSAPLRSRIVERSSSFSLGRVIAARGALRTSTAEVRPAITWLFVVANVPFSGEPYMSNAAQAANSTKPVRSKSDFKPRAFAFSA